MADEGALKIIFIHLKLYNQSDFSMKLLQDNLLNMQMILRIQLKMNSNWIV